jgi:hypothetical protein
LLPYVLAAGGAVALGSFTYFGIDARHRRDVLSADCGAFCEPEQVSPIRARAIAADVSLGVGIAAIGVAVFMLLTEDP